MSQKQAERDVVVNRRARHEYQIEDTFEAGIALLGSEVKSLRAGRANLLEAHVSVRDGTAWLYGCHVSPYAEANRQNHDPNRPKQLLLHRHEITKIEKAVQQKGLTAIPLRIYLKGSLFKVELAIARGKKLHDKRQSLKSRDAKREMERSRR